MLKFRTLMFATLATCVVPVGSALANLNTSLSVTCPPTASSGATINMDLQLVNNEPSDLSVRVVSGIIGNANKTLGGVGIYGPQVATEQTVSAFSTKPVLSLPAPPALPPALVGTVATYIVIAEWNNGQDQNIKTCLVEVQ